MVEPAATPAASPGVAAAVQRKADDLKWLSWNAAWHAANALASCTDEAQSDLAAFEEHAAQVASALPAELAHHVRCMVWGACWHAANKRGAALRSVAARNSAGYEAGDDEGGEEEAAGDEEEGEEEEGEEGGAF